MFYFSGLGLQGSSSRYQKKQFLEHSDWSRYCFQVVDWSGSCFQAVDRSGGCFQAVQAVDCLVSKGYSIYQVITGLRSLCGMVIFPQLQKLIEENISIFRMTHRHIVHFFDPTFLSVTNCSYGRRFLNDFSHKQRSAGAIP